MTVQGGVKTYTTTTLLLSCMNCRFMPYITLGRCVCSFCDRPRHPPRSVGTTKIYRKKQKTNTSLEGWRHIVFKTIRCQRTKGNVGTHISETVVRRACQQAGKTHTFQTAAIQYYSSSSVYRRALPRSTNSNTLAIPRSSNYRSRLGLLSSYCTPFTTVCFSSVLCVYTGCLFFNVVALYVLVVCYEYEYFSGVVLCLLPARYCF